MAQSYSLNLGLDIVPSSKDPESLGDLYRLYNAVKLLAGALDSYTGVSGVPADQWSTVGLGSVQVQNLCRLYIPFVDTVPVGRLVALNAEGHAILGTAGTVIGWAPAAVTAGTSGEVRLLGLHTAISGMTPGHIYYASTTTPGGIGAGPPTAEGDKVQPIGFAVTANALFFNPQYLAPTVRILAADPGNHKLLSLD